jgi:hypothetical protein
LKHGASFVLVYKRHIHCDWRSEPMDSLFFAATPGEPSLSPTRLPLPPNPIRLRSLRQGQRLQVWAVIESQEVESDDLAYEWKVTTASGQQLVFEDSHLLLPVEQGPFQIEVLVGGVWTATLNAAP